MPLGSTNETLNLQPGASITETPMIQLPSSAHPGDYYLLADLSGNGSSSAVASSAIQIVPKLVTIITPGFGVGPGGFFDATSFDNLQAELDAKITANSALDGNTYSQVYTWNSTQFFAEGLLALAAEQLNPVLSPMYSLFVAYAAGQADNAAVAAASELDSSLVQNELVDPSDFHSSGPDEQIIDLIGRGHRLHVQPPVTIADANSAFTVFGTGAFAGVAPSSLSTAAVPGSNGTQWAVTLTGQAAGVLASIANGTYSITVNPNFIFAASDGVTSLSAGRTDSFFRLYGDINGDGRISNADLNPFKQAFAPAGGIYNPAFDFFDGSLINNSDLNKLKQDFLVNYFG